jgi:hypothetical protein
MTTGQDALALLRVAAEALEIAGRSQRGQAEWDRLAELRAMLAAATVPAQRATLPEGILYSPCDKHAGMAWTQAVSWRPNVVPKVVCPICFPPATLPRQHVV